MNHFQLINDKRLLGSALACLGLLAAAPSAFATASPLPMAQAGQAVITASGVVEDAAGPLIGATVMEKGKPSNAVATDIDGRFSLKVPAGSTIVVSYIGYEQAEAKASTDMTIFMKEKSDLLDEVVVVGFGTQKKVNLTGSVSTVDTKLLNDRPLNNVAVALQGAVPGLQINLGNGAPRSTSAVTVQSATAQAALRSCSSTAWKATSTPSTRRTCSRYPCSRTPQPHRSTVRALLSV